MQNVIFFDLDGTLTPASTWYELNMWLGITPEQDKALFETYIKDGASYKAWMQALMELYRKQSPVTKEAIIAWAHTIELRPDALETIGALKQAGYRVGIISGLVNVIVQTVAERLDITDVLFKNTAVWNDAGELIDIETLDEGERDGKLHLMQAFCAREGIELTSVVCVEDGGNGLELFKHARGILLGENQELEPFAWKKVKSLAEIKDII